MELQYNLMTFGIPANHIPINMDGVVDISGHQEWYQFRLLLEESKQYAEAADANGTGLTVGNISGFSQLEALQLFRMSLSGQVPDSVFLLPRLSTLKPASNQLTGVIASATLNFDK